MKRENLQQMISYLSANNGWHSARQIADYLHTTPRTVRNYVQEINDAAPAEHPILSSRTGYRWNVAESEDPHFYNLERPEPQTPEERCGYVLRQLLYGRPVGYLLLTMRLAVSDRTLDVDLQTLKGILKPYHLRLRRSQDRLFLEGSQIERRLLSAKLIAKTTETEFLSRQLVAGTFPEFDAAEIETTLQTVLQRYSRETNGYTQYDLLLRIVLQMQQIRVGNLVSKEEMQPIDLAGTDYAAAMELSDMLSQIGQIEYCESEIQYLAALLMAKTGPLRMDTEGQSAGFERIQSFTLQQLSKISRHVDADFFSEDFPLKVSVFLQRMQVRQIMKLYTDNPLYRRIRVAYPKLQDICLWIMENFSRTFQIQIHSSEIGFLTMLMAQHLKNQLQFESPIHCTLICPHYQSMAADLTRELKARLGSSVVLHSVEQSMNLEQMEEDSELYLSVVPMRYFPHLVHISPFPKSEDLLQIWQEIAKIKQERRLRDLVRELPAYLRPSDFQTQWQDKGREERLCEICDIWERDGIVTPEFKTKLLCREAMDESTFFHTVALPHLCEKCVLKNAVYCVVDTDPVPWGKDKISVLLVIAFRPEELETFWTLYDLLIKVLAEPRRLRRLLAAKDQPTFLQILSSMDEIL